jgi:hypothetical protein
MTVLDSKRSQAAASSEEADGAPSSSQVAALAEENLAIPPLEPEHDAPPAYGDAHHQMQFSQPGLDAGARITGMEIQLQVE